MTLIFRKNLNRTRQKFKFKSLHFSFRLQSTIDSCCVEILLCFVTMLQNSTSLDIRKMTYYSSQISVFVHILNNTIYTVIHGVHWAMLQTQIMLSTHQSIHNTRLCAYVYFLFRSSATVYQYYVELSRPATRRVQDVCIFSSLAHCYRKYLCIKSNTSSFCCSLPLKLLICRITSRPIENTLEFWVRAQHNNTFSRIY